MLQRIYGTVWEKPEELKTYTRLLAEAKKRDHRKLGKELDLFSSVDEVGTGLILWHPKGAKIRKIIENGLNKYEEQPSEYEVYMSSKYRTAIAQGFPSPLQS